MVSSLFLQHSNPGHAGPFPVVSVHNTTINPTSPTTATMASANRGPTSPSVTAIELIPSVTNPENLPSLPDIPPIQVSGGDQAVGEVTICFLFSVLFGYCYLSVEWYKLPFRVEELTSSALDLGM